MLATFQRVNERTRTCILDKYNPEDSTPQHPEIPIDPTNATQPFFCWGRQSVDSNCNQGREDQEVSPLLHPVQSSLRLCISKKVT